MSTAIDPINVYLFPGIGSDERIFSKVKLNTNFNLIHIKYLTPPVGTTLEQYAHSLKDQVKPGKAVLIGVSIGGMFCVELSEILHTSITVIISSAKRREELPLRYRFQKYLPLNRLLPTWLTKAGALILQPIVEPDRNRNKHTFVSMLNDRNALFMKAAVNMVINWRRTEAPKHIFHIHGDNDHTLPVDHIKPSVVIKHGSHMMTLTEGDVINKILLEYLNKEIRGAAI